MSGRRKWDFEQVELFMARCRQNVPRDLIAEEMGATVRQVAGLWSELRRHKSFKATLAKARQPAPAVSREEFAAKIPEIRRMCEEGVSHRLIATRLGLTVWSVWKYVSDHGLIPEDNQKNQVKKRQVLQLPVNVKRVRLPDVNEDDVKLAEAVWRQFGKAS